MSYFGSTQSSSLANPPRQLVAPFAETPLGPLSPQTLTSQGSTAPGAQASQSVNGGGLWFYTSTNLTTDMAASANQPFFTDGFQLGMKPGDVVQGVQLSASAGSSLVTFIGAITAVTTAGASLSTGSFMTSTFS